MDDLTPATAAPWWRRFWWRHAKVVTAAEAERWITERNAWQQRISDALGLTWEDHGTNHSDLDRCVRGIEQLKAERAKGWEAAYRRGLAEGRGEDWRP